MHLSGGTAEPRGPSRAGVPDALRHRWLAPVHALLVSFLAVLLLGAVVADPAEPAVRVRLVTSAAEGGDTTRVPAGGVENAAVRVFAEGQRDLVVGRDGAFVVPTTGTSLTVCVRLPRDWSAPGTDTRRLPGFACWADVRPTGDPDRVIDLVVTGPEADR